MAPEDITHLLNTEGDQQAAPEEPTNTEAPAEPEPPQEPQYIRIGERDYSPDDLGTKIRIAEDYEKEFASLRKQQRALWEREQRAAEIERAWEQHQAQSRQVAAPQAAPSTDDPLAILMAMNQRLESLARSSEEERKFYKDQLQQQWLENQQAQTMDAYKGLNSWVDSESQRTGRKLPKFTFEELEQEAVDSGLAQNKRLPWSDVLARAYKNLAWERALEAAEQVPVQRLSNPRASVTVPAARGGSVAATPPPNPTDAIGNMSIADMREFFPERR